ncbi:depolymerase [Halomonas cibimaris]|uniref:Depolymerase n=1 Tax=Halomonas cibimaris TaxID=657012 RepID=A0ABP7LXD0_9GAMM
MQAPASVSHSVPRLLAAAGLALPLSVIAAEEVSPPPALPALGTISEAASAVGMGSGGYMATQLAVAWPERFHGLGALGAGPWGCAQGKLSLALNQCMMVRRGEPSLAALDARRADYQSRGQVGDDAALGRLRGYVWHGQQDDVVAPILGDLLAEQLQGWLGDARVKKVNDADAGHGWPPAPVAGEMMNWLYPQRALRSAPEAGALRAFDQRDFNARGLADTGYVYVPEACTDGGCGATLALHGCNANAATQGKAFAGQTGLNAWADAHNEVVLYPRAESTLANPQGCWDWWGFAESSWQLYPLHDTREGTQAGALLAMLERLQEAVARD